MFIHPNIDPVIFTIGPVSIPFLGEQSLSVQWYGLMYLLGFAAAYLLASVRRQRLGWDSEDVSDLIFYAALGVILGGRVGYMFLYQFNKLQHDPLSLFKVWEGGMSFHGGLLGVGVAMLLFARKKNLRFFTVTDFVAPLAPLGLFFGRMGNFINQELWGKTTDLPWGMVFSNGGDLPRHPSMLYEAFLEGLVLFTVLWLYSKTPRPIGRVTGLFLLGYGFFRFLVEFVRVPDEHIMYIAFNWLTVGQLYCVPMLLLGLYLLLRPVVEKQRVATT